MDSLPGAGDVVQVTPAASPMFGNAYLGDDRGFLFRVIRVQDIPTYGGWAWIDGYQLDDEGNAVESRTIYVMTEGLVLAEDPPPPGKRPPGRPRNTSI